MGAAELIVLLLSLGSFGVQANPNAPSAQEVMKYAPDGADAMFYLDLVAVVPNNWSALMALPDQPAVKASPELHQEISGMVLAAKGGLEMAKGKLGFDPVNDLHSVAGWVVYRDKGDPSWLLVARGKFTAGAIDKMEPPEPATKTEKIDGRTVVYMDDDMALGQGADGSFVFGTTALVKARVGAKWNPAKPKKGSVGERVGAWIDAKPFFLMASAPSAAARKRFEKEIGTDEDEVVLRDLATTHEFAAVAMSATGVAWTWRSRTKEGFEAAALASEGLVSLLRAGHHFGRGFAQICLAALGSYAKFDKGIAEIVKRRDDLLKLVWNVTGDGTFAATVDKNAAERTVTVKANGKTLSEVVPVGGAMIPAGVAMWMLFARDAGSYEDRGGVDIGAPPAPQPAPPPPMKKAK